MSEKHFIVIGNGPAGNEAAFTLREKAPEARISLVSRGRGSSYAPHLLPDFIGGRLGEEDLYVTDLDSYREKYIKLRCCQEAARLDLQRKEVVLDHKEVIGFDGLIIAVGGRPRIPEGLARFSDLMFTLKTLEDARAWIEKLSEVDSVLMIGGDLASFAVTSALIGLGKKVYFMFCEDAFWPLRWNDELLARASSRLRDSGVEVLLCYGLKSMQQLASGDCLVEIDGIILEVGMIGAFFGYVPDIRFLAKSGLRLDRGVLVDEFLNTGFPEVYATGDCAQIYHPELRDYWISVGYENARLLGRLAATNLAGGQMMAVVKPESVFDVQGVIMNTSWWADF